MTRDEILSMEAGRVMDVFVERVVFGYEVTWIRDMVFGPVPYARDKDGEYTLVGGEWIEGTTAEGEPFRFFGNVVPPWSRDMVFAMELVRLLGLPDRKPRPLCFRLSYGFQPDSGAWVYFDWQGATDSHPRYAAHASTVRDIPAAICRAALIAATEEE